MLAVSRLITDTLDCWLESRHDMTTMHPRYLPHTCPILITLGFVISSLGHAITSVLIGQSQKSCGYCDGIAK